MIIIDNVISPNVKVIITTEGQLIFDFIKEYIYDNPMHLMVLWWERNGFNTPYYVSKVEIHIIRTEFVNSVSYGSRF